MSATFHFQSLLTIILPLKCTCTDIRSSAPNFLDRYKTGFLGIFWKQPELIELMNGRVRMMQSAEAE
ncbi:unnamed protein product [Nyctereutes procyonoides]|uniref:Protein kish n=1 Tax=Nyctereutes procyonoides TaxID=34880 RepID=A0A811YBN9_NYCPR|nr:unnamed protein product [Nyctereutes procyonoides]